MIPFSLVFLLLATPGLTATRPDPSTPSETPLLRSTARSALLRFRRRNHGPGTSGGGSQTPSGELLKEGRWSFSWRTTYTDYRKVSVAKAEAKAFAHGGFDAVDHTLLETVSAAYGVSDDLELCLSTGYYRGTNFLDAEEDGLGGVESSSGNPSGLTDLWVQGRYRLEHDRGGHVAALFAAKVPTGADNEKLKSGELLEGSSQPSSGAWDFKAGLGYSRFLTPRLTMDAGAAYTLRTRANKFTVGDRADLGVDLAYRLTEDVRAPWNWSVFGELSGLWLDKDDGAEGINPNSGGTFLFATAGVRVRVSPALSLTLAPSLPVLQDLNGTQDEIDSRLSFAVTFTPPAR